MAANLDQQMRVLVQIHGERIQDQEIVAGETRLAGGEVNPGRGRGGDLLSDVEAVV